MSGCDCGKCEELIQPYLDRVLSDEERAVAELHLASCDWCDCRYRFEEKVRKFVRQTCCEDMSPGLKEKLAALRTPL